MKLAQVPKIEQDSLKAQHEYYLPHTFTDAHFEDIARIACGICQMYPATVCVIDKNGKSLKSFGGGKASEVPVSPLITDGTQNVFIVPDLTKDGRYGDHPFVTGQLKAVFYAGIPLKTNTDAFSGSLCIINKVAGNPDSDQVKALQALGRQVAAQIDLCIVAQKHAEIKNAAIDLAKIAHIASHDLKSPLNNIISLTHLLKEDYGTGLDEAGNEYINYLNDAAYQLSDLCNGILNFARSSLVATDAKDDIDVAELAAEVVGSLNVPAHVTIDHSKALGYIRTARTALKQILCHLLQNGIKYIDNTPIKINLSFREDTNSYFFDVTDNGTSLPKEEKEKIYALFANTSANNEGDNMGIDLSITRRLTRMLGGMFTVDPAYANGMSFTVRLPK